MFVCVCVGGGGVCVCVFSDSSSTGLFSSVLYFLAQEQCLVCIWYSLSICYIFEQIPNR